MPDQRDPSPTDAPLRILFGCETFPPDVNGSANFTSRLAAGLVDRGHEIHVVAPATSRRHGVWTEQHDGRTMTMHRWRSYRWPWHRWLRFVWPWRVREKSDATFDLVKPDVLHFQSHVITGRGLVWAARNRGIRIVGTNHTMPENIMQHVPWLPTWFTDRVIAAQWRSARYWYGQAETVTAPTQRAADYFEQYTHLKGVLAVSCGIDKRFYTPVIGVRQQKVITFVGRIDEEKYIHELLEAALTLDPASFERIEIIGDGDELPHLKAKAEQLGIASRVHFAGKVSDAQLRATLSASTVFAMPSRAELQSIATMEAMASALPVVGADAMALPHLIHDGENGHLYEPGDIDAFAAALADVLGADAAHYEAMQRASLEIVSHHDIERTLDVFEALYRGRPVPPIRPVDAKPSGEHAPADRTSA